MSDTPKKLVVDIATGISQYIDLTPAEIAQRDQDAAAYAEEQATRQAEAEAKEALKVSAKAKLVAGEPLTAEEAAVLVI
jgi:hypothetical protein